MTPEEEAAKKAQEEELNQILFKDFKTFVDSTRLYFANEYFALRLNVGNQSYTYVLTPHLAKMLSQTFSTQIDNFEKHVRPIVTNPPILSPVQLSDLQKPDDPDTEQGDSGKPKPGKPGKD